VGLYRKIRGQRRQKASPQKEKKEHLLGLRELFNFKKEIKYRQFVSEIKLYRLPKLKFNEKRRAGFLFKYLKIR